MRKLRVLLFTNTFPIPSEPERGIYKFQLAKALQEKVDLRVVCPLPWFPKFNPAGLFSRWYRFSTVPDIYEFGGIEVHAPKYAIVPKISRSIHCDLMFRGVRKSVDRLVEDFPVDLIHSHWLYPDGVVAQWVANSMGVAHIPTGSGSDVNSLMAAPGVRRSLLPALHECEHIVVVSRQLRDRLVEYGVAPDKVTPVTNGVDTGRFDIVDRDRARESLGLPEVGRIALYVGRLSAEKAVVNLVTAFARVATSESDVSLVIAGEGREEEILKARAAQLGLGERVRFLGNIDYADVPKWISAANCTCLPSLEEGCPNVMLESLASGVPVVASRVGAVGDFITDECGRTAPPGDIDSFTDALLSALNHDWSSADIRKTVVEQTWDRQAGLYKGVFDAALSSKEIGGVA